MSWPYSTSRNNECANRYVSRAAGGRQEQACCERALEGTQQACFVHDQNTFDDRQVPLLSNDRRDGEQHLGIGAEARHALHE